MSEFPKEFSPARQDTFSDPKIPVYFTEGSKKEYPIPDIDELDDFLDQSFGLYVDDVEWGRRDGNTEQGLVYAVYCPDSKLAEVLAEIKGRGFIKLLERRRSLTVSPQHMISDPYFEDRLKAFFK